MRPNRRAFLRAASGSALTLPLPALAAPRSETLVASLFQSLNAAQKRTVAFPYDHPLRTKIDNNWQVTKPIAEVFTRDQQRMIRDIFLGLHSEEHAQKIFAATVHDQEGEGFEGRCSVGLFGTPGTGKFQFVLSGRHVTRRCDGDSAAGVAFGGPIFYGHQAGPYDREPPDHPKNVYWFQALRANEVWKALDGRQRKLALQDEARWERGSETVALTKKPTGIPLSELAGDQRLLVRHVLADLLAPFRKADADEVLALVDRQGLDKLHLAFFREGDLGGDGVWDVWQLESPSMVWFFRGAPHVHVWVHVTG